MMHFSKTLSLHRAIDSRISYTRIRIKPFEKMQNTDTDHIHGNAICLDFPSSSSIVFCVSSWIPQHGA
jgi:hypothetical protein